MTKALAALVAATLLCLAAIVWLVTKAQAEELRHPMEGEPHWYDRDCCSNKDCYPLPEDAYLEERPGGDYYARWISPLNGKLIEGIVRRSGVRDTRDGRVHGCEASYTAPRCIYIHRGA